jgi:hypothetical protein
MDYLSVIYEVYTKRVTQLCNSVCVPGLHPSSLEEEDEGNSPSNGKHNSEDNESDLLSS